MNKNNDFIEITSDMDLGAHSPFEYAEKGINEDVEKKNKSKSKLMSIPPSIRESNKKKIKELQLEKIVKESIDKVLNKNEKMPKLNELYESTGNNAPLLSMKETTVKRLLDRHSESGFIIISACRGASEFGLDTKQKSQLEKLNNINNQRTRELLSDIQKEQFSYTPCYGGFIENQGTEYEETVYEKGFIVYPTKLNGETDMAGLKRFGIDMAKKFNQDDVLVKEKDREPTYYKKDGTVDFKLGNTASLNDLTQIYFTDLHKNTENKISSDRKATRFSFPLSECSCSECYISPIPQCYSESHIRYLKGEVFCKK